MPKIERETQKIFASQAGSREITEFGTAKDTDPVYTDDVGQIQNENFLNGWQSALLPDKSPWQEDMNALFYAITSQLGYLFQDGLPEYDTGTTYYTGALVKVINGSNVTIYKSLADNNTGNAVSNTGYWKVFFADGDMGVATYEVGLPQPTLSNNLYSNEIWLEGQEVSRTTYSQLFNIYGTTYGAGNGSTTFNLPDFRNRVLWGSTSFGYMSAANPSVVIPNSGWSVTGKHPGTVTVGTLIAGSGKREISETLESLSATSQSVVANITGNFNPPAIKCRFKTRYQ